MNLTFLSGRARLLTHLTGWSLVSLLFFALFSSLRGPEEGFLRMLLNSSFLAVLFYGNARWLINRYFETGRYGLYASITILCWIGAAALRTWVELHLFGGSILTPGHAPCRWRAGAYFWCSCWLFFCSGCSVACISCSKTGTCWNCGTGNCKCATQKRN